LTRVSFLCTLEAGGGTALCAFVRTGKKLYPPHALSVIPQRTVVNGYLKESFLRLAIDLCSGCARLNPCQRLLGKADSQKILLKHQPTPADILL
jgi:hypothetical protein